MKNSLLLNVGKSENTQTDFGVLNEGKKCGQIFFQKLAWFLLEQEFEMSLLASMRKGKLKHDLTFC